MRTGTSLTLLTLLLASPALPHDQKVHVRITDRAVEHLKRYSTDARLRNNHAAATKLKELLRIGAEDEDAVSLKMWPLPRSWFHYYPALDDWGSSASCDSVDWAFLEWQGGPRVCWGTSAPLPPKWDQNEHRWRDAVKKAEKRSMDAWVDLGYVIHLLEDLASPARVKNDAHPTYGLARLDPCPFENWAKKNAKGLSLPRLPAPSDPAKALVDLSGLGDNAAAVLFNALRDFTDLHFNSNDRIHDVTWSVGPEPDQASLNDTKDQYFYGSCLSECIGPQGSPPCINLPCPGQRRRIAKKGGCEIGDCSTDLLKASTSDDDLLSEQFDQLSQVAVVYVASLIQHFVDYAKPPIPGSGWVVVGATLDGRSWDGPLNYMLGGPDVRIYGSRVWTPHRGDFGVWGAQYRAGGPPGAVLLSNDLPIQHLSDGQTITFTFPFVSASQAPVARFTMTSGGRSATEEQTLNLAVPAGGSATVSFSADRGSTPSGTITGWEWKINDALVSTAKTFSRLLAPASYRVSLVVTDSRGLRSPSAQGTIVVGVSTIPSRRIFLLRRNQTDDSVTYMRNLLSQAGIPFTELAAADVASANLASSVIVASFSATPTEYAGTPTTAIKNAVAGGSWMIADAFGKFILAYGGVGSAWTGGYSPAVLDKYGYVKAIDSSPLFAGIPAWDPPSPPDNTNQYTNYLLRTGGFQTANYAPPAGSCTYPKYWAFAHTPGWGGLPTNSTYCQAWGGCTSQRTVGEGSIAIMTHGSGKVMLGITGVGHVAGGHEYGPVMGMLFKNFITWASQ